MSEHIGKFQEVGFTVEGTRGTAESTIQKAAKKVEADFYKEVEKAEDESVVATLADINDMRKVNSVFNGSVSMNLHADTIGYLFSNIFGSVSSSEIDTSGVYEHNFTLDESIKHTTLTTFLKEADVNQVKVANTVVDTLSLSVDQDSYVTADIDLIGTSAQSDTSSFSYDTERDFIARDLTVKIADSLGGLSTSDPYNVKSLDIDIETGAEPDYVSDGEYDPQDIFQGNFAITVEMNLNYIDETFKDLYDGDGSKYMRVLIQGDEDLGGTNNATVEIDLYDVFVEGWDRDSSQDEVITQDVTLRATYNESDDTIADARVVNTTTDYNAPTS